MDTLELVYPDEYDKLNRQQQGLYCAPPNLTWQEERSGYHDWIRCN